MHKIINIDTPADVAQIVDALKQAEEGLSPSKVAEELEVHLSDQVKCMLVEYPYVDKDYRSTYYNFYSKKSLRYSSFCARLHFFREKIELSPTLQVKPTVSATLQNAYLGFMVIRPTFLRTIGRTIMSPSAFKDFRGHIIQGKYGTHVLGERLEAEGFPFMKQHGDVAVCAHVACWSILRHFSERFPGYRELLTYDITRLGSPESPGGLVPSKGLTYVNAATILAQAGAYPDVHAKAAYKDPNMFYRLLYSYVESGLPIFAAMNGLRHAITVVGHGPIPPGVSPKAGPHSFAWDYIQSLVVADDNFLPYRTVTFDPKDFQYTIDKIDYFVVPLPEKVYFTSAAVMAHTTNLLTAANAYTLDFSYLKQPIIRHFLTTSSAYKRFLSKNESQLPRELVQVSLELPLPQFIWVSEVSTVQDWATGYCHLRFVFDATAYRDEPRPFFLIHDRNNVVSYDRGYTRRLSVVPFSVPAGKSRLSEENMKRY
jgi:hypothetical protein